MPAATVLAAYSLFPVRGARKRTPRKLHWICTGTESVRQ